MTSTQPFRRFAFAYGLAFAILYVIALKLDLALFTVYPSLGVVLLGTHHARDAVAPSMAFVVPAMYWYGWTAMAALGALLIGVVAALWPERWTRRFWPGWLWDGAHTRYDRVRLSHHAVVSTLARTSAP
jgi:hypothetical protein